MAIVLSQRTWASGVLVSPCGYCLTNAHLFAGRAQPAGVDVRCHTAGGALPAEVVHVFTGVLPGLQGCTAAKPIGGSSPPALPARQAGSRPAGCRRPTCTPVARQHSQCTCMPCAAQHSTAEAACACAGALDLAVLRLHGQPPADSAPAVVSAGDAVPGQPVAVVGFPLARPGLVGQPQARACLCCLGMARAPSS